MCPNCEKYASKIVEVSLGWFMVGLFTGVLLYDLLG